MCHLKNRKYEEKHQKYWQSINQFLLDENHKCFCKKKNHHKQTSPSHLTLSSFIIEKNGVEKNKQCLDWDQLALELPMQATCAMCYKLPKNCLLMITQ